MEFPEVVNTFARGFSYSAELIGSKLKLSWSYKPSDRAGNMRQLGVQPSKRIELAGVQSIDLQTGVVTPLQNDDVVAARSVSLVAREQMLSYRYKSETTSSPWTLGKLTVYLVTRDQGSERSVVLKTIGPEGERQAFPLTVSTHPSAYLSSDHCYVFLLAGDPNMSQPWNVFSTVNGALVGKVPFESGSDEPTVMGTRAYWFLRRKTGLGTSDLLMRAADLRTGNVVWDCSLGTIPAEQDSRKLE
jgi:hypothetical protein